MSRLSLNGLASSLISCLSQSAHSHLACQASPAFLLQYLFGKFFISSSDRSSYSDGVLLQINSSSLTSSFLLAFLTTCSLAESSYSTIPDIPLVGSGLEPKTSLERQNFLFWQLTRKTGAGGLIIKPVIISVSTSIPSHTILDPCHPHLPSNELGIVNLQFITSWI